MPTELTAFQLSEKVFMAVTKAKDCLSRARDGLPEYVYDQSQLKYSGDQLEKARLYVVEAQLAVSAMSDHIPPPGPDATEQKEPGKEPEAVEKPIPAIPGQHPTKPKPK
jgi:hypothetical protein